LHSVHSIAPLRLGLAGGGTDVTPYVDIYGGQVLNATISLATQVHLSPNPEPYVEFKALDFDQSARFPLSVDLPMEEPLILHRATYRRIVQDYCGGKPFPVTIHSFSDCPPGSGVGSSSTLVVALVAAFQEYLQLPLGEYDIARLAYQIERIDCGMSGGRQDQYAAAFGGVNFIEFAANDRVIVNPLRVKQETVLQLESHLLLYFTGRSRVSAEIIDSQIAAAKSVDGSALEALHKIKAAASDMKEQLLKGNVNGILDLLGSSWQAKKLTAAAISNSHIEEIADAAMQAGAIALKISGAGGGGFMMIGVHPKDRYRVIRAMDAFEGRFFTFRFVEKGVQSWRCN